MSDTPRTDFVAHAKAWANGAKDKIVQLERELAEAKKDAERYRWLRERHENTVMDIYNSIPAMKPELLDAEIDAAMKEGGK